MRAESTIKPAEYAIEVIGDVAIVTLYQNIVSKEVEDDKALKWEYDYYTLTVKNRPNLSSNVYANFEAWLDAAIEKENEPKYENDKEIILRLEKKIAQQDSILEEVLFEIVPVLMGV